MEKPANLDSLAPKAPGYIFVPTTFRLDGETDDFVDWDPCPSEPDPECWADDPYYWLLVFRVYPEKEGKWVQLSGELMVDELGRHRSVPLGKHWGKDVRPPAEQSAAAIVHAWGWRYPDSHKIPYELYTHWILASPFQLAWPSLPPLDAKDRTCARSAFETWAEKRGLRHTFLTSEDLRPGKVVVPVSSAWQEGFARNRALVRAIEQTKPTPWQRNARFLHDLVNLVVHQNSLVLPHLKKAEFDAFGEKLAVQERQTADQLTKERVRFKGFLKSKSYLALKDDAEKSKDPSASAKMTVILGRVSRGSAMAAAVVPELREQAAEIKKHLRKHYDSKTIFRATRKAAKSYWYLVKTFLEVADVKSGVPEWLIEPCQSFARTWYGLPLPTVPTPDGKAKIFDGTAVADIKRRSTESIAHLRFFAVLEAVNVGYAISDLYQSTSTEERGKKLVFLAGTVLSLWSGRIELKKAMSKEWTAKGLLRNTKVLGAGSSLVDATVGAWAVATDVATNDNQAAAFHGVQAAGGVVALVGYILLATGVAAPVGALLVFLGSALGLGGSLGASVFKSSDIENWVKYCKWGVLAGKEGVGEEPKSWADGRPRDLHEQLGRQIRTLNALLIGLEVELTMVYDPKRPEVEVVVHANMIADDGVIHLELIIQGLRMRKMSPWKRGKDRGPDGTFRERFSLGDAANVTAKVRLDPFGNGLFWHPADKAHSKSAVLTPPKGTLENPFLERPF